MQEEVSRQYALKEQNRQQVIQEVQGKMNQLESVEAYLIDQLGKTQNTQ